MYIYDNLEITFLGICSAEIYTYINQKTCMEMFIASLFTMASNWKLLRGPSMLEWAE